MPFERRVSLLALCICLLPILLCRPCAAQELFPDPAPEILALIQKGRAAVYTFQYQEALLLYDQALKKSRNLKDRQGEIVTLNNIGVVYNNLGQPQKALDMFEQALVWIKKIGDKYAEGTALNNIGLVYSDLGQPQKALEYLERALPLERETGDRRGEANTLNNIGLVYETLGQPQKALETLERALPLEKETVGRRGEAVTLSNIGHLYAILGQPQKALEYFERALPLTRETEDRRQEATILNNFGRVDETLGHLQKALETFLNALALAESVSDLSLIFYSQWHIGGVQQKQGQKEEAIVSYRKAIASLESIRGGVKKEEDRQTLLEGDGKVQVYESLVQLLTERGRPEDLQEALRLLDSARSKQLLDSLRLDSLTVRDPKLRQLLSQTQALELQVAAQEKMRQDELNKPKEQQNPDRLASVTRLVAGTRAEMRAVTNTIAENFPTDFARFVAVKPVDLKTLQNNLPPGALVIEYSPLETALLIFLVTHDSIRTVALPLPRQKVEGQVEAFRKEMERAGTNRAKPDNPPPGQGKLDLSHWNWNTPAARPLRDIVTSLYSELIAPMQTEFASASQIVIIPNGLLCYLPFPALAHEMPDHTLRFFAEEKRLSVLPQLRLWNEIADREAKRKPERGRLALFGNPDGSLPGAQTEAKAIGSLYANALLYLGADVTKEHLSALPPDIGMAHLATHGILDSEDVNNSYLLLAGGQKLKLTDLYGLTFPFHMAVLSACDTAVGHKNTGIEQATLADAFVDAGSTTLIASLWPVSDASTAALMERFYRELKAGKSVSESLQIAEVSLLHNPATAHPYFWSPFTLLGDWR